VSDGQEVQQGSDPLDASDGGNPPAASDILELPFHVYGDYAAWEMTVRGLGPDDTRVFKLSTDAPNDSTVVTNKLRKGNSYRLTMRWRGSGSHVNPYWYCWEAQVGGLPSAATYNNYSSARLSGVAETVVGDGWFADNKSGLLTSHVHMKDVGGGNVAGGLSATLYVPKVDIVPDWNRDRQIDDSDRNQVTAATPFRFWINDDNDESDTANDDTPGHSWMADFNNLHVDGRCDLLDFFPVWLDLHDTLNLLPPGDGTVEYKLTQADGAVRIVYTSLTRVQAGSFLTEECNACGLSFAQAAHAASILRLTAFSSLTLDRSFLNKIKNNADMGVILVEGSGVTTSPLVLEVWKDGVRVCRKEMPLRLSGVEEMFERANLRNGAAVVMPGSALPPDNGTHVFFLHGFKVTEEAARMWHAEMFKRLWQSGSNARFHGVTWYGDETVLGTLGISAFHYQENVENAFHAAEHLKDYVAGVGGTKVVIAHSLGNMVVSSAIADWNMDVGKCFMLNAAVASEAYDETQWKDSPDNALVHEAWKDYTNVCWSAEWHRQFAGNSGDARARLTWKDRFASILSRTTAYNFFSSGDEVFELYNGTPYTVLLGDLWDSTRGRYAWHRQETHKGRGAFDAAGTSWSGWGFRLADFESHGETEMRSYRADEAANLARTPGVLATNTVFDLTPASMNKPSMTLGTLNAHLAEGIPALSPAAGQIAITFPPGTIGAHNYDMNIDGKPDGGVWPNRGLPYYQRWLHSDLREMAFFHTHKLFEKLSKEGALQ